MSMCNIFMSLALLVALTLAGQTAVAGEAVRDTFVLGPGDTLEVSVWDDESLQREVLVRPDGMISFPLIGDVEANGRTVDQLREAIADKIKEYIPSAPVTVVLNGLGSRKVYIVGKVNRPGMYIMEGPMTVVQALALAGGMNAFADDDDIQVIRLSPS